MTTSIRNITRRAGAAILATLLLMAFNEQEINRTKAKLYNADTELQLSGTASYVSYPSLYSFFLEFEQGRCGMHFIGMMDIPKEDLKIEIGKQEDLNVRMICVFEDGIPKERLSVRSGTIQLAGSIRSSSGGRFRVSLIGDQSGNIYEMDGIFDANPRE